MHTGKTVERMKQCTSYLYDFHVQWLATVLLKQTHKWNP